MIIYLCLVGVAAVAAGIGFYAGRVTAPECERQHHETQIVINRARLTKLDADGAPVGDSVPLDTRTMSMTFEAETGAADVDVMRLLVGPEGLQAWRNGGGRPAGQDTGRHAAVAPDEAVTEVVPVFPYEQPPSLLKPVDQRPDAVRWPDEPAD